MLRNLFFILNILPLVFLTTVSELKKDELKVEIIAPETAERGKEITIELAFTRGQVKGFAKYTEDIPRGVEVEPGELGNATFTYDANQLKIIWLNIPDEDNFKVSYKLKFSEDAPESIDLSGKFSYLENNEKKSYHPVKKSIVIGTAGELAKKAAETAKKNEVIPASASVTRSIVESKGDIHTIRVSVSKKGIEGFSKIEEIVSMGAKVTALESQNAVFSSIKNKVKFIWMSVPTEETFSITYQIDLSTCSNKDPKTFKGQFSYLDNNVSKQVDILFGDEKVLANNTPPMDEPKLKAPEEEELEIEDIPTEEPVEELAVVVVPEILEEPVKKEDATVEAEPVKKEEPVVEPTPEPESIVVPTQEPPKEATKEAEPIVVPEPIIIKEEKAAEPVVVKKEKKAPTEPILAKKQVVSPDLDVAKGVNYRVQIAAGKNVVDAQYFSSRHQWTQNFAIENHEGWVKYTTGSYAEYKAARDSREGINAGGHKFMGPFVTAYNDGSRITVQEALMITKQKWYK